MQPLAVITGVGPGTGSALVRRFSAGGFQVAMLARNAQRLAALEAECPGADGMPCDVADAASLVGALAGALAAIDARSAVPQLLIHNAVGSAFGNFLGIDPVVLNANFQVHGMALMHLARWAALPMTASGRGCRQGGRLLHPRSSAGHGGWHTRGTVVCSIRVSWARARAMPWPGRS